MRKILILALVIGILISGAAFAAGEKDSNKNNGEVDLNVEARYYPATFSATNSADYNLNAIWLKGDLFALKDRKLKASMEWYGGNDTQNAIRVDNSQVTGRLGYDVWEKTYLTVNYKHNRMKVINTVNYFTGVGFGVQKHFDLSKDWPAFASIHYYPTLHGPGNTDFHTWEYEVGLKYKWPKAVDISLGYRGEAWNGFNTAVNQQVRINGPFIGIGKEF